MAGGAQFLLALICATAAVSFIFSMAMAKKAIFGTEELQSMGNMRRALTNCITTSTAK